MKDSQEQIKKIINENKIKNKPQCNGNGRNQHGDIYRSLSACFEMPAKKYITRRNSNEEIRNEGIGINKSILLPA